MSGDNPLSTLIDWLMSTGRKGGCLSFGLGVLVLVIIGVDLVLTGSYFVALLGVAGAFFLLGIILLVVGSPTAMKLPQAEPGEPLGPELIDKLQTHPRPYIFCTRCRKFSVIQPCEHCDSGVDCYEVRDEEDLKLMLASIT